MASGFGESAYVPTTGVRRTHALPLVAATSQRLAGLGALVADPHGFAIEVVRWPAQGWRPGDQGGIAEGVFEFAWRGQTLYARNHAVGDAYLFGWSDWPETAAADGPPAP